MNKVLKNLAVSIITFVMTISCFTLSPVLANENIKETADSIVYTNELPDIAGNSIEEVSTGYTLANTGGNNHAISSLYTEEFDVSFDLNITEGQCFSFIFGSESKVLTDVQTSTKFFGLEFKKASAEKINVKLFYERNNPLYAIPEQAISNTVDTSGPVPIRVVYTKANGLKIYVDNVEFSGYNTEFNFDDYYTGGYLGFLTWNAKAVVTDLSITVPFVTTYENTLPNFAGANVTTLSSGYAINNTGGNNHAVSSLSAKQFTLSTDATYVSGDRFSVILGSASSNYAALGAGGFYGLEFMYTAENKIVAKMFYEYGILYFENQVVAENLDKSQPIPISVSLTDADGIVVDVNGTKTSLPTSADFKTKYADGGYIGFLTWNSEVKLENLVVTPIGYKTYDEFPDFTGTNLTKDVVGYRMFNNGGNNLAISSVKATEFTYESNIDFEGGNKTTFAFGAGDKNFANCGNGKSATFFGLEFDKSYNETENVNEIRIKLFQDGPSALGDQLIPTTLVTTTSEDDIDVKVSYTKENGLEVWVDGTKASITTPESVKNAYAGGYFGFLTFQTQAFISNIKLTAMNEEAGNFVTNLTNLAGMNGTWKIVEDGLYSTGSGDNFALSETVADNFIFEADVKFADGAKGAASLVFRSGDSPASASYVANIVKADNLVRIFRFPGGSNVCTGTIDASKNTFKMRVEAIGTSLKVYIDDALVAAGNDDTYTSGKLGLLTWDSTVTYQNVKYTPIDADSLPTLTDLTVTGDGVTFNPEYDANTVTYNAFLPAGVNKMFVTASADADSISYELVGGSGVTYDSGTLTSGTAKEIIPSYGASKMIITTTKGEISSSVLINITKKADASDLANQEYRPQLHFSPEINFMNDPNGLVYDTSNNTWHMFFQYSPQLPNMGSQTWGHAVSDDLVNWVELPVAIEMDKFGAIFSGSCVVDEDNTSGFFTDNEEGESKLVAIYTNAGSYGMVQNIAYSTDHGVTWTKYATPSGDPVIPDTYHDGFRDPKVFKVPGDAKDLWYMVVAGGRGRIFISENLKEWTLIQELYYANGNELHSECPDLYPLEVLDKDGNPTGTVKWVYNAASEFYVVGDMVLSNDGYYRFNAETNQVYSQTSGASSGYAAQSYYNDPVSGRRLTVHWMQDYSAPNYVASKTWNGVQSFPEETNLKKLEDGSYLITQNVADEVKALRAGVLYETENVTIDETDENILAGIAAQVYEIEATFDMETTDASRFGFELRTGSGEKTLYYFDKATNKMVLDKSASSNIGYENQVLSYTLKPTSNGKVKLRAIVDNSIIETFGNDGDAHLIDLLFAAPTSVGMSFFVEDGSVTIDDLTVYDMKSIYTGESVMDSVTDTYVSVSAPEYVDVNEEFSVIAAVYPAGEDLSITWDYDEEVFTLVSTSENAITLIPTVEGEYTISAIINDIPTEKVVNVITKEFNTNLEEYSAAGGSWNITDHGVLGANKGAGDSFYVSKTKLEAEDSFTFVADMWLEDGRASGILLGVTNPTSPASHWYCLNSDVEENGGYFKFFKNTGSQNWSVTAPYGSLTNRKYRLKVEFDAETDTFTFYTAPYGSDEFTLGGTKVDTGWEGGHFGVMTFQANASFNNVYLYSDALVEDLIVEFEDVNEEDYTEESYAAYKEVIEEVEAALEAGEITVENIDEVQEEVAAAKEALVSVVELKETMEECSDYDAEAFTEESVEALESVLEAAEAALVDGSEEEIEEIIEALKAAYDGLESKQPTSDEEEEDEEEEKEEGEGADTGDHTNTSGFLFLLIASLAVMLRRKRA